MRNRGEMYSTEFKKVRARVCKVVDAGEAWCVECGLAIVPGTRWHLAHDHRFGGIKGPSHARCNARERNKRVARRNRRLKALVTGNHPKSRVW